MMSGRRSPSSRGTSETLASSGKGQRSTMTNRVSKAADRRHVITSFTPHNRIDRAAAVLQGGSAQMGQEAHAGAVDAFQFSQVDDEGVARLPCQQIVDEIGAECVRSRSENWPFRPRWATGPKRPQ